MVTAEELAARRRVIGKSPDLQALFAHQRERAQPVLDRMPPIPEHKALLSSDGGLCPDDGSWLTFDPWSPSAHRCPRCGKTWTGERHDQYWARYQHLWLAERAAHLATLTALDERGDARAAARSREILSAYADRYWQYPNRDNVLGPSRLFFSTYLESLWICNYLAAAMLLRGAGELDDATARDVNQVAEEGATLIGDYDETFSNRQTWNNAALAAVAVWFEDEELAQRVIEGPTGLVAHLTRGYGRDGMWYEGENYHLFALRGLLTGAAWARLAGVDFAADPQLSGRLMAALRAPALSALPDFTFPARKDSRFGVSLAQPMYVESWEIGLARLGSGERDLSAWLRALYQAPPAIPELLESYLHEAPINPLPAPCSRSRLSWWALLDMPPELPPVEAPWSPSSVLLESQGLAVLRAGAGNRYVSLECGPSGGGHGHPDRLHLTVHADGVHWLADPGTGSYTARELFWYRSTLAHNAPRLDAKSQEFGDAACECFEEQGDWAWARGRYGSLSRTVVTGPTYIVDAVELTGREEHVVELPWHVAGRGDVETKGRWVADEIADEFVTRVERFVPDQAGPIVLTHAASRARLTVHLAFDGELLRAEGPGLPGSRERAPFYVVRVRGRNPRIVTVLESSSAPADSRVRAVRASGDKVEVETAAGVDRHRIGSAEWTIEPVEAAPLVLRGARDIIPPFTPLLQLDPPTPVVAAAFRVGAAPPLDGTLEGFETAEPLQLALEDQYRRSEDPYPGPDDLSALAYAAWDDAALYLAVEVTKPDLSFRPGDAAPLRLDNEPDDIHSDGLQLYVAGGQDEGRRAVGYLIIPEQNGRSVRVRTTSDTASDVNPGVVRGTWLRTDTGYRVTVAVPWPAGVRPHAGARVGFDLIINEMLPGRTRRVGQLVWSGGGGWVWLRGDRHDPARFGVLDLVV
jgi:hypothetical protein